MWPFKKQRSQSAARTYRWKEEQQRLWSELVPPRGQADTLQGELIRIVGKLTDQAYRNGNINWDADHERMWRFVGRTIDDAAAFTREERHQLRAAILEIIRDHDAPDLSEDGSCYYVVCERTVDWCMAHPEPIRYEHDPDLNR